MVLRAIYLAGSSISFFFPMEFLVKSNLRSKLKIAKRDFSNISMPSDRDNLFFVSLVQYYSSSIITVRVIVYRVITFKEYSSFAYE